MPREIAVFDPGCAAADILEEVRGIGLSAAQMDRVKICSSWRECVQGAGAACILTQWKQFRGRQLGSLGAATGKTAKPAGHGAAADAQGAGLSEMGILGLEKRTRQGTSAPSDDPLRRLKPLTPCPADCSQCGIGPGGMQDQEAVDWVEAAGMMQEPRWVFDGRNVVDHIELQGLGFKVRGIGKGFHSS
jgi:UDPglucose 6-dehydrogenase